MLSVSKIESLNHGLDYYTHDNYYTKEAQKEFTQWYGKAAELLGLKGTVDINEFKKALHGVSKEGKFENKKLDSDKDIYISYESVVNFKKSSSEYIDSINITKASKEKIQKIFDKISSKNEKLNKTNIDKYQNNISSILNKESSLNFDDRVKIKEDIKNFVDVFKKSSTRRPGYDLTFSAPKSLSIAALVGGDKELISAHREAVTEALRIVELEYSQTRVRESGNSERNIEITGNIAAATFEHDVSRKTDPQLHTHCVLMNFTKKEDGTWRSIHQDGFFYDSKKIGLIYQNELAKKVNKLGYDVTINSNGTFDIKGYSKDQLEQFSKRTSQLLDMGAFTQKDKTKIIKKNRDKKEENISRDELLKKWQQEANSVGIKHPEKKLNNANKKNYENIISPNEFINKCIEDAVHDITSNDVSFKMSKLESSVFEKLIGKVDFNYENIKENINNYVEKNCSKIGSKNVPEYVPNYIIELERETISIMHRGKNTFDSIVLEQESRKVIDELHNKSLEFGISRFTETIELFVNKETSIRIIESLKEQNVKGNDVELKEFINNFVTQEESKKIQDALRKKSITSIRDIFLGVNQGQQEAINVLLTSNDRVFCWQGVAGAGKSFSLGAASKIAMEKEFIIKGFAPSAEAAKNLAAEAKLSEAHTVASLLVTETEVGRAKGREIWIVDEAGLLSAQDAHALLKKAEIENARVLLVGDTRQLSAVGAGNPFKQLLENGIQAAQLIVGIRQKDKTMKKSVDLIADGKHRDGLEVLDKTGKVYEVKDTESIIANMANDYLKLNKNDVKNSLFISSTNYEKEEITNIVRSELKSRGEIQGAVNIKSYVAYDYNEHSLKYAHIYNPDDVIILNKKSHGLIANKAYKVLDVLHHKNSVVVQTDNGKKEVNVSKIKCNLFKEEEIEISVGDRIKWTKNHAVKSNKDDEQKPERRLNGQYMTVKSIDNENKKSVFEYENGKLETVELSSNQFIDYSYVTTVFSSQGKTCDKVYASLTNIDRENFYVAVSRAKFDCKLYTKDKDYLYKKVEKFGANITALEKLSEATKELSKVDVNNDNEHILEGIDSKNNNNKEILNHDFVLASLNRKIKESTFEIIHKLSLDPEKKDLKNIHKYGNNNQEIISKIFYYKINGHFGITTKEKAAAGRKPLSVDELKQAKELVPTIAPLIFKEIAEQMSIEKNKINYQNSTDIRVVGNTSLYEENKEIIKKLRNLDPSQYLISKGYVVKQEGNHYSIKMSNKEEFRITKNSDGHYVTCDKYGNGIGDNIALVQKIEQLSFKEAIIILNSGEALNKNTNIIDNKTRIKDENLVKLPLFNDFDSKNCRDYLTQRGISASVISYAEKTGFVAYAPDGVLFLGYNDKNQAANVTKRSINENELIKKRDLYGSDKFHPQILKGSSNSVWIVEGGMDALALHELALRAEKTPPTVIVTGGANTLKCFKNPLVQDVLKGSEKIIISGENEKDLKTQIETDLAHRKQQDLVYEISGKKAGIWKPQAGLGKDVAEYNLNLKNNPQQQLNEELALKQKEFKVKRMSL